MKRPNEQDQPQLPEISIQVYYCSFHNLHSPKIHFIDSKMTEHPEKPNRINQILDSLQTDLKEKVAIFDCEREATNSELLTVHSPELINFINNSWESYYLITKDETGELVPSVFPMLCRGVKIFPKVLYQQIGHYCFDNSTPIGKNTAKLARISAGVAIDTTHHFIESLKNHPATPFYALCRPPGHHTTRDAYGGYCYFNNVALAADILSKKCGKVVILDVDYHHGNGTQDIFYDRDDVFFISIHADPEFEYPLYSGAANEIGIGPGENFNRNFPLPAHTTWANYEPIYKEALNLIEKYNPVAVVVSLGLDAADGDPICLFHLKQNDYYQMGESLRKLGKPVLVIQEGGYSETILGDCATSFLKGLLPK